jgi:hypothetical protein
MKVHLEILGLAPYDLRASSAWKKLWNARDERGPVPLVFGTGWLLNLGSVPRHPLQALLTAAPVARCWRAWWRG